MDAVFVDTWAWVALALKRDQHRFAARVQHAAFQQQGRKYVTTDFVVSEVITQLYRLLPSILAQAFVEAVIAACESHEYSLVHVSSDQFQRAWGLRRKYADKPGISFVDFTSMVVMTDEGISDIFTGDSDFRQVNLGFQMLP